MSGLQKLRSKLNVSDLFDIFWEKPKKNLQLGTKVKVIELRFSIGKRLRSKSILLSIVIIKKLSELSKITFAQKGLLKQVSGKDGASCSGDQDAKVAASGARVATSISDQERQTIRWWTHSAHDAAQCPGDPLTRLSLELYNNKFV
ncbi:hypothetical protein PoB_006626200 [Plakobranchus ocellatus]|uniref:Uncharacterized protein n=1 Tax=Plakobranchus ocellatus TaxID=259542 RepID=A0AAV4D6M1_9GAST|nr:hypothetical protein PoB_006626200 [Plakobranchus ocellatus]